MDLIGLEARELDKFLLLSELEFHPDLIKILEEFGVIETRGDYIGFDHLLRLKRVMRLRSRLGVNLNAAAIVADLLERIEALEDEIEQLRRMR